LGISAFSAISADRFALCDGSISAT